MKTSGTGSCARCGGCCGLSAASGWAYLVLDDPGQLLGLGNPVGDQFHRRQLAHEVAGGGIATDIPLVVLVDGETASAAEIVTGAIQDAGRAKVVGETTYGTGTVVGTFPLSDGSAVTIGTERWLTPKGHAIWRQGLTPDETVALPQGVNFLVPDDFATLGAGGIGASSDTQEGAAAGS